MEDGWTVILRLELPRLAAAMDRGDVVKWYKHPGDQVGYGDHLCEIEVGNVDRLQRQLGARHAIRVKKPGKAKIRSSGGGVVVRYLLTSKETGSIGQILATEGTEVRQGDLLALIVSGDPEDAATSTNPARVVVNLAEQMDLQS
jgi:hypothetical protein